MVIKMPFSTLNKADRLFAEQKKSRAGVEKSLFGKSIELQKLCHRWISLMTKLIVYVVVVIEQITMPIHSSYQI